MRANILYDKLSTVPEEGSLIEAVCILVQRYRWDKEQAALLVSTAAAMGNQKALKSALEMYTSTLAPYATRVRKDTEADMKRAMDTIFGLGPIRIRK